MVLCYLSCYRIIKMNVSGAHKNAQRQVVVYFFPFKISQRIKLNPISASVASTVREPLASVAKLENPLAREFPLRLLSPGLLNQRAGS